MSLDWRLYSPFTWRHLSIWSNIQTLVRWQCLIISILSSVSTTDQREIWISVRFLSAVPVFHTLKNTICCHSQKGIRVEKTAIATSWSSYWEWMPEARCQCDILSEYLWLGKSQKFRQYYFRWHDWRRSGVNTAYMVNIVNMANMTDTANMANMANLADMAFVAKKPCNVHSVWTH